MLLVIGWDNGKVELGPNPAVRDPKTGLIVAFRQETTMKKQDVPSCEGSDGVSSNQTCPGHLQVVGVEC